MSRDGLQMEHCVLVGGRYDLRSSYCSQKVATVVHVNLKFLHPKREDIIKCLIVAVIIFPRMKSE